MIPNVKRRVKGGESGVVRIHQIKTRLGIGAGAGASVDREWDKAGGGCIDSTECNRRSPHCPAAGRSIGKMTKRERFHAAMVRTSKSELEAPMAVLPAHWMKPKSA